MNEAPMKSMIYGLKIGQCENQEEYEQLVHEHAALYTDWNKHILPMLSDRNLKSKKIAEGCGISDGTAQSFVKKIPAKRENVIMLAMMMRLTVEETDDLLMRWAKFQKLYPKHPGDAIWIYLLEQGGSDTPAVLFREYYAEYKELHGEYLRSSKAEPEVFTTQIAFNAILSSADSAKKQSSRAKNDPVFRNMIRLLLPSFEEGYRKLMDYIDTFFTDLEDVDSERVGLNLAIAHTRQRLTPNRLYADKPKALDRYYREMRDLKENHTVPSRMFLIALGLRLSMETDQINTMLELAGMGPLCPKDRLEGTIFFYLEDLYCQFPTLFNPYSLEGDPLYGELQVYARPQEKSGGSARSYESRPEIRPDFDDIPTESLLEYIRRRLEETNIFHPDDRKTIKKFLEIL